MREMRNELEGYEKWANQRPSLEPQYYLGADMALFKCQMQVHFLFGFSVKLTQLSTTLAGKSCNNVVM